MTDMRYAFCFCSSLPFESPCESNFPKGALLTCKKKQNKQPKDLEKTACWKPTPFLFWGQVPFCRDFFWRKKIMGLIQPALPPTKICPSGNENAIPIDIQNLLRRYDWTPKNMPKTPFTSGGMTHWMSIGNIFF